MGINLNSKDSAEFIKFLKKVKRIIKKGWTQGEYARNKYGHEISPLNRNACKWCMVGACIRAANTGYHSDGWEKIYRNNLGRCPQIEIFINSSFDNKISKYFSTIGQNIINWNDSCKTKEEVLSRLNSMISAESPKGQKSNAK